MKYIIGIIILITASFLVVKDKKSSVKISVVSESSSDEDVAIAKDVYDAFVYLIQDDIYQLDDIDDIKSYLIGNKHSYSENIISNYPNATVSLYCNNTLYDEYTYMSKKCDLNKIVINIGDSNGYSIMSNIKVSEVIMTSDKLDVVKPVLSR